MKGSHKLILPESCKLLSSNLLWQQQETGQKWSTQKKKKKKKKKGLGKTKKTKTKKEREENKNARLSKKSREAGQTVLKKEKEKSFRKQ